MANFDYTLPIALDGEQAKILWVDMSRIFPVYYMYTMDPIVYFPFDEFGNPFSAGDITTYSLQGIPATQPLENTSREGSDIFFTV